MTKKKETNNVPDVKTLMKDPQFQEEFSKLVEKYAGGPRVHFEIEGRYLVVAETLRGSDDYGDFIQDEGCEDYKNKKTFVVLQRYFVKSLGMRGECNDVEGQLYKLYDVDDLAEACRKAMYETEKAMWEEKSDEEVEGTVLTLRASFRIAGDKVEKIGETCRVYNEYFNLEDAVATHIEDFDENEEVKL